MFRSSILVFYPRVFYVLCLFIFLSGCGRIHEFTMSASSKVNAAYPRSVEVRLAEDQLRALLETDKKSLKTFDDQYETRLALRTLTCSKGNSIGRLETVADVKKLGLSLDCFSAQDADLLQYLGIRQIGLRIAMPPLRPLIPLGPASELPHDVMHNTYSGFAAAGAAVAVLLDTHGELTSIEIPGGKKIASLLKLRDAYREGVLSPNGRVAAIPIGNYALVFVDTETGIKLWEATQSNRLFAWMPELAAVLLNRVSDGALMIADTGSGTFEPHPLPMHEQAWGTAVSKFPSRVLIGNSHEFALIEHSRHRNNLDAVLLKRFRLTGNTGITSSPPTLMRGGNSIVFVSMNDIGWFNLESGKGGKWAAGELIGNQYAKLSETELLVDAYEAGTVTRRPMVFDIVNETIASVMAETNGHGIITELAGRTGYMRRGYGEVWFGDSVKTGPAQPLDTVLVALNQRLQTDRLRKLAEAANIETTRDAGFPVLSSAAPPTKSSTEKNEPLAAERRLEEAVRKKILRRATIKDAENWIAALKRKYAIQNRPPLDIPPDLVNAFVVLKKFTYPAGLYGAHSVVFYIPPGVPRPTGNYGHSRIYDLNSITLECNGAGACGQAIVGGQIGGGSTQQMITIDSGSPGKDAP